MNRSCLRIERDLRDALYQRLQRLPVAFHDRWASGQLLSRATTDVSTVRRFVGLRRGVPRGQPDHLRRRPRAAAGHATGRWAWPCSLTTVPLTVLGLRWERRYNVQSRRVQDEQGELATDVEEAVQGIRVVKSLGRSGLVFDRYDAQGRPGCGGWSWTRCAPSRCCGASSSSTRR